MDKQDFETWFKRHFGYADNNLINHIWNYFNPEYTHKNRIRLYPGKVICRDCNKLIEQRKKNRDA